MSTNTLVSRCLAYGVQIIPIHQQTVFKNYEKYEIPEDILNTMSKAALLQYTKALYLCSQEMACDWTRGFSMLKGLGFIQGERTHHHRTFVTLTFEGTEQ